MPARLRKVLDEIGISIVGPNCMGVACGKSVTGRSNHRWIPVIGEYSTQDVSMPSCGATVPTRSGGKAMTTKSALRALPSESLTHPDASIDSTRVRR